MAAKTLKVLERIWVKPDSHRAQIAAELGIHPNSVCDAVRQLIADGWVAEGERKSVPAGRSPISLHLDPAKRAALAVVYDPNSLTCALLNAHGRVISKLEKAHSHRDPDQLVDLAAGMLAKVTRGYSGCIIGIGVADPGMVDCAKGEVVRSSSFPRWRSVPLAKMLAEKTGIEVFLENNSRVRAMAHYLTRPELRQAGATMLYVDYGQGICFSVVTPKGIWNGAGFAGEVGHVVMKPGGELCGCGARGCLESLCNSRALETEAKALLARGISSILQGKTDIGAGAVFEAAVAGDRMARSLVDEIISPLKLAVTIAAAAFHPHCIVVGADSVAAIRYISDQLASAIRDWTLPEIASSIEVTGGKEIGTMGLIGAALMVFDKVIVERAGLDGRPSKPRGARRLDK